MFEQYNIGFGYPLVLVLGLVMKRFWFWLSARFGSGYCSFRFWLFKNFSGFGFIPTSLL